MKTLLLFLCGFLFYVNVSAQPKIYTADSINNIILFELKEIQSKLLQAAKSGKILAYKNDSLNKFYRIEDINEMADILCLSIEEVGSNFSRSVNNQKIENNFQLNAFIVLYKPILYGLELPKMPMFFVSLKDANKVLTPNERQLVIILSNLAFGTVEFAETLNDDIISNNIRHFSKQVYFNDTIIKLLSKKIYEQFLYELPVYAGPFLNKNNLFKDENLVEKFSQSELNTFLYYTELRGYIDKNKNTTQHPVYWHFLYENAEKIMLSKNAIGLNYIDMNYEYVVIKEPLTFYISRKEYEKLLPSWLKFIIENYL